MPGATPVYTENFRAIQLLDTRTKALVMQELKQSYLWYRLLGAGNVLNVNAPHMEIPFYLAPPAMGKWVTKNDKLPDASSSQIAMGYVSNRFVVVPVGWDLLEQWQDEGNPNKIFDMIDMKSVEQSWALRRTLTAAAWAGTGGKQPDGISTLIEAAAPSAQSAVVMGVDKAAKPWFRNKVTQLTQNFGHVATGSSIPAGFLAIINLINQCTIGTEKPSDIITGKPIFDVIRRAFLESSTPYHMISEKPSADYGFESFSFLGVRITWDSDCPADKIYALHLDTGKFDRAVMNDTRNKVNLDRDLEDIGKSSLFDMDGGIFVAQHPRILMRNIAPRSPYRDLQSTNWKIHSFNIGLKRMSDHGVAYSDNGSRWSTWS
jgi:hypothetical protein